MEQIKVELQGVFGNDRFIAEAAWTSSFDKEKRDARTDEDIKRVVNMLADSKHSVPFESIVFRFWIRMPIATDRQFMTHRIASHSGLSGRYRTVPIDYLELSDDVEDILNKLPDGKDAFQDYYTACETNVNIYRYWTDKFKKYEKDNKITNQEFKRLREFYRGINPQHCMTERTTVMNLRSFANFIKLRLKPEAQPEIRFVAEQMLKAVKESNTIPVALEALERNNWII